jgi:hypothetical protein
MFVGPARLAWARDQLARRFPAKRVLSEIVDSAHEPFLSNRVHALELLVE